jgi:hypothetical protein
MVTVVVNEPQGDDRIICDLIREDRHLADAIISPVHVPDPETVETLEDILRRFPSSSYADYARFALARAQVMGVGLWMKTDEDRMAERTNGLLRGIPGPQLTRAFRDAFFPGTELRGKRAQAVTGVIESQSEPEEQRQAALAKLLALCRVTKDDRIAAARLLEDIRGRDFPYRPNALIMLLRVLYGGEPGDMAFRYPPRVPPTLDYLGAPARIRRIREELDRDFPDSKEWMEAAAHASMEPEDWLEFRIRRHWPGEQRE